MANPPYDNEADKERSPVSNSSTGGNSSFGHNSDNNPYDKSLSDKEETAGDKPGAVSHNQAGKKGEHGASSSTGDSSSRPESSPEELKAAESEPEDIIPFNPNNKKDRGSIRSVLGAAGNSKLKRRALLLAAGSIGGLASLVIVAFFVLIPLKIEHIITNLQDRFFATSENAVNKQSENFLSEYVKKYVMPTLTTCSGSSINKDCNPAFGNTNNPVDSLYKGWSQARLENKLATDYHIEFSYNKYNHKYYMKAPGIKNPNGDDITGFKGDSGDLFQQVSRGQARQAVRDAMANETQWKKVLYRYKVGRLLEEKYGITRCLIFCGVKDALADKTADQKVAAKLYLVQRVITPRTQVLGVVMECILDTSCEPEKTTPTVAEDTTSSSTSPPGTSTTSSTGQATIVTGSEEAGAPKDLNFDANVLQDFAASRGSLATAEELEAAYKSISEDGYQKYLIDQALSKIGLNDLAGQVLDNASIIQWVGTVSKIIVAFKDAGPKIKKLEYATNSQADVKLFSMYRTYADEIHTGHVSATEVGSMVDSLGPVSKSSATSDLVGGTASAEETPLYNNLITGTSTATGSARYTCSNHSSPGKTLICPEEKLAGGNTVASSISKTLSTPPFSYITSIAGVINSILGPISSFVGNLFGAIISHIPGVSSVITDATSFVSQAAEPALKGLVSKIIPDPFGPNMSGGRTFDLIAAGADTAGNDFAHSGLGGEALSATTAARIASAQANEAQQDFSHQPLFARLFSTDSQYSLISRLAMDMPLDIRGSTEANLASLISDPLQIFSSSFASIFTNKVSAATGSGIVSGYDVFGVTQYAPVAVTNATSYWALHCSDNASNAYQKDNSWNEAAAAYKPDSANDPSGEPVNTTANPCLTIKTSVGAAGGIYDSSLLTPDDLADVNGSTGTSTGNSTSSGCGGSGKYSALVSTGSSFAGVDQGIDFVPSGSGGFDICAPASGTITLSDQTGHHFDRTSGQAEIIEKLDQPSNAPSSSQYIYYAEIIQINSSIHVSVHVNKGDIIGHSDQSPGIEVGWGLNAREGFMCPIGYPTPCGTSFNNWVQAQ